MVHIINPHAHKNSISLKQMTLTSVIDSILEYHV